MRAFSGWAAVLTSAVVLAFGGNLSAQERAKSPAAALTPELQKEAREAIARGVGFLRANVQPDGSLDKNPGIASIALLAVLRTEPRPDLDDPFIRKPLEQLVGLQKADGGIYDRGIANYVTGVSVQVLVETKDPRYKAHIQKARRFLLNTQLDGAEGVTPLDANFGGWSYGGEGAGRAPRADLSNTQMWADAMRDMEQAGLERDSDAWKKAVAFVSRCQNKSETNDQKAWVANDGGATYSPSGSKAYEVLLPDGRTGLRSYGSMTYAFLKTMIYADVKKDDPRVRSAFEWVSKHYTVEENPGVGPQGLFYYYHTMAKALRAMDEPAVTDAKGVAHDWRAELARKLLSLQNPDGSWVNRNDRWFESNPTLVTAYGILTLEELLEK